ncbi:MAG TPA: patatin-like phospholipase family protein [Thermoanaerobaculia bacterium]|nr:patatin-like phospholipase family protein [Thermoanaerobaculia bacterium]
MTVKPQDKKTSVKSMRSAAEGGPGDLAIVLTGGGARAAYQVGLLRGLARRLPDLHFDVITGISAGAINASLLASHPGSLREASEELTTLWSRLHTEQVFRVDSTSLGGQLARWGSRLLSGGRGTTTSRGMVDTAPLRRLLLRALAPLGPHQEIVGIRRNIDRGRLSAAALTTLDYSNGNTVTWVEGRDIEGWTRDKRRAVRCRLTVDHVMASASLPLFFPAVRIGPHWHGDGGMRLTAPFSPALHLGAGRVIAVTTRYVAPPAEEDRPQIDGYPPPAQILGHLMNAVFLDVLDEDAARLARTSRILERLPPDQREGMRPIDLMVLRPSVDLGALAADYEPRLPGVFRFLTRGLGTQETKNSDLLSMLMFEPEYLTRCIEIGEADSIARLEEIERLVAPPGEERRTGVA